MSNSILLTGATGFIGSHLTEFLVKKGLALAQVPENFPFFLKITFIDIAMIDIDNKIRVTKNNILMVYNVNFFFQQDIKIS